MYRTISLVLLGAFLTACAENTDTAAQEARASEASGAAADRGASFASVSLGARLYQQNCASCHGEQAEGAPNWRERDPRGFFPPPPLNGTGHAWHHPRRMLHHVIANGSPGGGRMPAWRGKLSDREIAAIIDWFISRWPDEVYAAWKTMDERARQASR